MERDHKSLYLPCIFTIFALYTSPTFNFRVVVGILGFRNSHFGYPLLSGFLLNLSENLNELHTGCLGAKLVQSIFQSLNRLLTRDHHSV